MGAPEATATMTTSTASPRGLRKFFGRRNNSQGDEEQQEQLQLKQSLSSIRSLRASKKGKKGILAGLLPKGKNSAPELRESKESYSPARAKSLDNGSVSRISPTEESPNRSPHRDSLFQWQDHMEEKEKRSMIQAKQLIKERDGFCRRVDTYDGQVISVEGKPAYELGNYLGGGVAGVVYEGHRLQPMEEYPVRFGVSDTPNMVNTTVTTTRAPSDPIDMITVDSLLNCGRQTDVIPTPREDQNMNIRDGSLLTVDTVKSDGEGYAVQTKREAIRNSARTHTEDVALEATESSDQMVIIDTVDAPSRSKHYAKAISMQHMDSDYPDDASISYGIMEETVAIKVLNPVGFRTVDVSVTRDAVIARQGAELEDEIIKGARPMEERHVWWLVNPNSRNLRTLQRYSADGNGPRRVEVDRGSPEKGLRISLIAAYKDPKTNKLKELPLTRCIEIWGHVPFSASDNEFNGLMTAIDRINQGQPPPPVQAFGETEPGRVATETSSRNSETMSLEGLKVSTPMRNNRT